MLKPCVKGAIFAALLFGGAWDHAFSETSLVAAPPEFKDIRATLTEAIDAGEIPSMALAVAREGEIVWMEGLGWADREAKVRAHPNTVFAIGSTSKSMTATLAMALSEKGLINIDEGVDEYLNKAELQYLSQAGRYPTIRQLLTMTGGVPHGGGVTGRPEYTVSREDIGNRVELVAYPPGTLYEYSNYSIGLAMRAMERAADSPFDELMRKYVFEPLGMENSSTSYRVGFSKQAKLYGSDGEPIDYYRFYPEAAGGFYSSAADLMRFALFHAGQQRPADTVISTENLQTMHNAIPSNVPGAIAALGFGKLEMPTAGVAQLISNGNVRGGNSHVSILTPTGDVVVAVINMTSRDSKADSVAIEIAERLRPGIRRDFESFVRSRKQLAQQSFNGHSAWTGKWVGKLESPIFDGRVELSISDGGEIKIALDDSAPIAIENARFYDGSVTGRVTGLVNIGTRNIKLFLHNDILYGHTVGRIADGETVGDYPYRMLLERDTADSN